MKTIPQIVRGMSSAERFLGIVLLLHLVLWTLVPSLLYNVLPLDSLEAVAWGSGFSLGNAKHPPLTGWIAGLTASATGHADWSIYLLSQLCVAGGMACIYFLAREFLGREESMLAALTPEFIFYYNVTTPEFNVNLPMMLLWPAAALFFVRACRHDRIRDWILLGVACGFCFLCKYYSVLLFAGFAVFLLLEKDRRRLLLHAGPWIAVACACLAILPHAMWAFSGGLAMMEEYVEKRMMSDMNESWFRRHCVDTLLTLGNAALVVLVPLGAFWLTRWKRPHMPTAPERREGALFAVVMTGVPLLLLTVIGLSGKSVRAMWLTPLFFPLGILLAAVFPAEWTARQQKRFRVAVIVFFTLCIFGFAVAGVKHSSRRKHFPARQFTAEVARIYMEKTGKPLEIMIGSSWTAGMFRQYAPGHPQGCIWNNRGEVERLGARLKEHGGLAVQDDAGDMKGMMKRFGTPDAQQFTMDVEYHSLFGKKRTQTVYLAILDGSESK